MSQRAPASSLAPSLPTFSAPAPLDLLDLEKLPGDEQLCATTLQGLVNRSQPRIYLLRNSEEGAFTWLQEFTGPFTMRDTLDGLLARYRDIVKGMIVYDPALPDSINVAVTLAGLEDCVVVSPRLAARYVAAPFQLATQADLRGRFADRLAAYQWQVATLWPRCTRRLLVGVDPARGAPLAPYGGGPHDYAVATRAMVVWLDPNDAAERALLEAVLRDLVPDTPYIGWFPGDVSGEFGGIQLASTYGVYVLAADYFANLTVHAGQPAAPVALPAVVSVPVLTSAPSLERAIYVTFTMTEGDNLQYMQHRMRRLWDDPGRGQVPLNWGISPVALDAAPTLLAYYLRTRSPNDYFIAGPSGAGYTNPNTWPAATFGMFTQRSAAYLRRLQLEVIWALNRMDGQAQALAPAQAQAYIDDIAPQGILLNYEGATTTSIAYGGLPQAITQGVSSVRQALDALARAERRWDGRAPLFLSFGALAWEMTPSDIVAVAHRLSPRQRIVRADEYFRLVRAAYGL